MSLLLTKHHHLPPLSAHHYMIHSALGFPALALLLSPLLLYYYTLPTVAAPAQFCKELPSPPPPFPPLRRRRPLGTLSGSAKWALERKNKSEWESAQNDLFCISFSHCQFGGLASFLN